MSYYEDQDLPRRHRSHRRSRRPAYEEEEVIETRGTRPSRQMDLIPRPRDDSVSSVEEVRRDFAPPGEYVHRRVTTRDKYASRARSVGQSRYSDDYDDDSRRSDGALSRRSRDKKSSRRSRYDSESDSYSPPRQRRKSLGEQALAAIGLGGAAGSVASERRGGRARSRSRGGGRRDYSESRSPTGERNAKIQQAVKAALTAGAVEAFRSRKEPGGWQGQGKRVLTAAIGAAGIDGATDRDPDKHSTRHTVEAVIGGLAGNRLINGARDKSRSRSRGRGPRDQGSGGLGGAGALAATGLAALAGKAFVDRGKSRDRRRGRSYSSSSDDSRGPPRRARSKSVSAYIGRGLNKGMAAIGLGDNKDDRKDDRRDYNGRRQIDDGYAPRPRGGDGGSEEKHGSGTDSYDSEEEMKKHKKMRGKEFLTAGLASVATIHAAHSLYQAKEKRDKHRKEVSEGKMSPEEAKKLKNKGRVQEAASVGIAALGIKGAFSEWKEMKEQRDEYKHACQELEEKRERRRLKQKSRSTSSRNSEPNMNARYQSYGGGGPRYQDGNPYAAGGLPPPPIGQPPMRY